MKIIGAGQKPGTTLVEKDTIFTIPNLVTVVRFFLVFIFAYLVLGPHNYFLAAVILMILASTDWVDGYLARRLNQVSKIGKMLDPLVDRVSLIIVALTMSIAGLILWWVFAIIVCVDIILALEALILFRKSPDLEVTKIGKIRTAILFISLPLILLCHVDQLSHPVFSFVAYGFLYLGVFLHILTGIDYFYRMLAKSRNTSSLQSKM